MDLRERLFNFRSYTPIPILIAVLVFAEPTVITLAAGFAIALSGELIRIISVRHAGGSTRRTSGVGAPGLVTHGPYAYLRNPLYLGNFVLSTGLLVMAWAWMPWMLLILWAMFAFQYSMIISLEEEFLHKKFGKQYAEYCRNVPRIVPRTTPYQKLDVQLMPLTNALRIENNTLISFTVVCLVIFLRWKLWP